MGLTIKEAFRGYRDAQSRLATNAWRLESEQCTKDAVRGSSSEWPYTFHTMTVSGQDAAKVRRILAEMADDRELCRRVEEALSKAPNREVRDILTLHYIEGLKWEEVADLRMGDKQNTSGSEALRKRAQRFLDSL